MGHQVQHGSICRLPASFQNLQGATGGFGVTDRGPIGRYFNYNVFVEIDISLQQFVQFGYKGPALACEVCGC
jgi:hypothetical protein